MVRCLLPDVIFLVPGYGAQGGSAAVTKKALTDPTAASKYRWLPAIADSVANCTPKPRTPDEPQFEDILGEPVGRPGVTAHSHERRLVCARCATETQVDATRVKGREGAELFGNHQWRMVRKHHTARTQPDGGRVGGHMRDEHGRSG